MGATAHSTEPQCWCPSTSLSPAPDVSKVSPLTSPASLPRAGERHHCASEVTLGSLTRCSNSPRLFLDLKVLTPCLEPNPVLPQREGSTSPTGLGCAGRVWDAAAPGARDAELCTQTPFPNSPPHPCLCSPGCSRLVINHMLGLKSQREKIEP